MSRLIPRTLTNDSAQGKQKVYFCCHPDDFERFFDIVCDDIFKANPNCAIYYDTDLKGSYDKDDLLLSLLNMQVFVVAVSRKLLENPSRVIELDIPFATGKIPLVLNEKTKEKKFCHIAVLPIIFEGGLDKPFNDSDAFNGMQYLLRYDDDDTTLNFEEKLKRYLDAVLVSDEEKTRIKKEFLAKIFLSYRKDDRALAQKLMELIHDVDFCRDVAIWYDEYLVPGEKWEENIMDELTQSDLFLLNVTENLLVDGNFVFREEYPNAQRSGKPILPAETESVNRDRLEDMYHGTKNDTVIAYDKAALSKALEKKLIEDAGKKELLSENNAAEHLYYIALAYKNNVEVEPNAKRAVALLEQAGESGYQDAFYTLGQMYEKGDSVECDEDRAIQYYYEYIEKQKKLFGTSKEGDLRLLLAYDAIGMIYRKRSELGKAFSLYEELNQLLENMTSCYGSFQQINLPASYERLGNIKKEQGDFVSAQEYFQKAMEVRMDPPVIKNIATEADRRDGDDPQKYNEEHMKSGLAVNYYSLGEVAFANRNITDAKKYFTKANMLFEELVKTVDDPDIQVNLAKSYINLGKIEEAQGKTITVRDYYRKAIDVSQNAAKNIKNYDAQIIYVVSMLSLGDYYRKTATTNVGLDKAMEQYEPALKAALELKNKYDTRQTKHLVALLYGKLGLTYDRYGDKQKALYYFEQDLVIAESLDDKKEDFESQRGLAIAHEKIAGIHLDIGEKLLTGVYFKDGRVLNKDKYDESRMHFNVALSHLEKDEAICERLYEEASTAQTLRDLSVCYDSLCTAYTDLGSYENAIYDKVLDQSSFEEALSYCVRGLVIANKLAENNHGIEEMNDVALSYLKLAGICEDVSDECIDIAIKHWQKLSKKTKRVDVSRNLSYAKRMRSNNDYRYPITKGFTNSVDELIDRYASDLVEKIDDMQLKKPDDNLRINNSSNAVINSNTDSGQPIKKPSCLGCLLPIIIILLIIGTILQLTGVVDIIGWIKSIFGNG